MWTKDRDGKGYSIEQSELDHLDNSCPGCGSFNAGVRWPRFIRNEDGELECKIAYCAKCGTQITIFND